MSHLEIRGLSKNYGDLRALDDLSFSVGPSEIFGFVGSNGAGKSTTMRIALGVLEPTAGDVLLDGVPLNFESRRRIGYMPEERGLYPKMKVGDQLVYIAQLHGMPAAEAKASMLRWTERLGIESRRGDIVQALSLGNQQRVQLAAALVHEPDILVLDEPFSGLDPVAVDVMSNVLKERAAAGAPVIFSSHQLDLVERLCTRVGIIKSGKMVAVGTVDELQARAGNRWRISMASPTDFSFISAVPGASMITASPTQAEFLLSESAVPGSEQQVLSAAIAAGVVESFGRFRMPLADLFRDAVSSDDQTDQE